MQIETLGVVQENLWYKNMKIKQEDFINKRFGRLIILSENKVNKNVSRWLSRTVICKCDCGNNIIKPLFNIIFGGTKSCGCLGDEVRVNNFKTGGKKTRFKKGFTPWNKGIKMPQITGENHYLWRTDRDQIHLNSKRLYLKENIEWRNKVFERDNYKCRICNKTGRLEAHHILQWRYYPELRFDINNGITLCHAHHPRKEAEEKRLIPTFKELVSVS